MLNKFNYSVILAFCLASVLLGSVTFTQNPDMQFDAGANKWTITFSVSETTDVEVSIIALSDSTIVRHLAAGLLGSNPPAPLSPNTLSQSLEWDGKDDYGQAPVASGPYSVRVRAGIAVKLDKLAGGSPYKFFSAAGGVTKLTLCRDDSGNVYVRGPAYWEGFYTIRRYSPDGIYQKTVFPFSAGLGQDDLTGFDVAPVGASAFSPRMSQLVYPQIKAAPLGDPGSFLLPIGENGKIAVGNLTSVTLINKDGSYTMTPPPFPLITSPVPPPASMCASGSIRGTLSVTPSFRSGHSFISGIFAAKSLDGGCWMTAAQDTGFWRDGCVYLVDNATGMASIWLALPQPVSRTLVGKGEVYGSLSSAVATDDGHVLVCDRSHSRIGVYDTSASLVDSVSVAMPFKAAYHPATRDIFVLTSQENTIRLCKYAWTGAGYVLACRTPPLTASVPEMLYTVVGASPVIWLTDKDFGAKIYQDNGDSLVLIRDFNALAGNAVSGFDRPVVDKRNETVYFNGDEAHLRKIEDWSFPTVVSCSTSTRQLLNVTDAAISPDHRLYVMEGGFCAAIKRYSLDHLHAPLPYAETGNNILVPFIYNRYGYGGGISTTGLDVTPNGTVVCMSMYATNGYFVYPYGPAATTDSIDIDNYAADGKELVYPVSSPGLVRGCGGVKLDLQGNLYIGAMIRNAGHVIPAGFTADPMYDYGVGAVVRYPAGGKGTGITGTTPATRQAPGSDLVYTPGLGAFSGEGSTGTSQCCHCRSPRFDVDPYGRLFIPNAVTQNIAITDNNDNAILTFGQYGNWDSQGEGSLAPTAEIAFGFPTGVAVSDHYLYVTDLLNTRLVRVKMDYALDNMPGVGHAAAQGRGVLQYAPTLAAAPNPFNPAVHFRLSGNLKNASLKIFDCSGRLAEDISGKAEWNARNRPAGLYFAVLECGGKRLVQKLVLAK